MERSGVFGLVILATEGVNGTVAGAEASISEIQDFIREVAGGVRFKDSISDVRPFKRVSVDVRAEIVGLKRPDLVPEKDDDHHLSAEEWHAWVTGANPPLVIDTRNDYELRTGKFRNAVDPGLKSFSDWGRYLDEAALPQEAPVLIYCTGGIRCEKAILEMRSRGFERVYQLRDGILGYLEKYPDGAFEGECFVFDDRVTVGPELTPTGNFGVCPGCGLPSDAKKSCLQCGNAFFLCAECEGTWPQACSKACRDRVLHRMRATAREAS